MWQRPFLGLLKAAVFDVVIGDQPAAYKVPVDSTTPRMGREQAKALNSSRPGLGRPLCHLTTWMSGFTLWRLRVPLCEQ